VDRVSIPAVNEVSAGATRPSRCPRHSTDREREGREAERWIRLSDLWTETFRLFFPVALFAGLLGVLVWPLVFWGWMERSPFLIHTRLMSLGFFGGFVFGFLGTSVPRLLKARPFTALESIPLLGLHLLACGFYLFGEIPMGDGIMTLNACLLVALLLRRVGLRREVPAPGFLMVIPGFVSVFIGLGLASLNRRYTLRRKVFGIGESI
jgi:uncharacterized protein involved in response to NO